MRRSRSPCWGYSSVSERDWELSTHALGSSEMAASPDTPTSVRVLKNADVIVLAVALVLFLIAGFPILGWVAGAGAWAIQRGINELAVRKATNAEDVRARVGLLAGSM